jgi:hypothetical protein
MAREILFDIDKVSTIEIIKEALTNYVWQEEIPSRQLYIFGFIPVGRSEGTPAGWAREGYYEGYYASHIQTEEDLRGCFWYRLDMKDKKVYNRANVKVHLGFKETISQSFDSDEEASEWVHELNELSGKNFVSVEYK